MGRYLPGEGKASALITLGGDAWWFLPTDPEARAWRGPFTTRKAMDAAMLRAFKSIPHVHVVPFYATSLSQ